MKSSFFRALMASRLFAGAFATAFAALDPASAATSSKQDNANNLNQPSSWDVLPGPTTIYGGVLQLSKPENLYGGDTYGAFGGF